MTATAPLDTFDITADLAPGTTLLEASAGTGKTWTIAALVDQAHRGRRRRASTRCWSSPSPGPPARSCASAYAASSTRPCSCSATRTVRDPANRLHDWLLDADDAELARRLDRLTAALVSFDAATIATIHQFCQLVLRSLGVAGDTDASATLVEDLEQLTAETVDDLYLARFGSRGDAPVDPGRGARAGPGGRRRPAGAWWSRPPC